MEQKSEEPQAAKIDRLNTLDEIEGQNEASLKAFHEPGLDEADITRSGQLENQHAEVTSPSNKSREELLQQLRAEVKQMRSESRRSSQRIGPDPNRPRLKDRTHLRVIK